MGDRFHGMARRAEGSGLNRGARYWWFESTPLQRRVCEPSVPPMMVDVGEALSLGLVNRLPFGKPSRAASTAAPNKVLSAQQAAINCPAAGEKPLDRGKPHTSLVRTRFPGS